MVEYQVAGAGGVDWVLVSNSIPAPALSGQQRGSSSCPAPPFTIHDLQPGTAYTVRVTAHNSAGSAVEQWPGRTGGGPPARLAGAGARAAGLLTGCLTVRSSPLTFVAQFFLRLSMLSNVL